MAKSLLFPVLVLISLAPATLLAVRGRLQGAAFIASLVLAVLGPVAWAAYQTGPGWQTGFSAALWVTIAVTMGLYAVLALFNQPLCRLAPLLLPYLMVLGAVALFWGQAPSQPLSGGAPSPWLAVHIGVSVLTYALLTLSATAAVAVFLRERALKRKVAGGFSRHLPSVADGEHLELRLLAAAELVLLLGVVTGMANEYLSSGTVLRLDHKTLLVVAAFVVIGVLLIAHQATGVRGRRAARVVLVGYMLVTLAYPGVKFVTDVLMS